MNTFRLKMKKKESSLQNQKVWSMLPKEKMGRETKLLRRSLMPFLKRLYGIILIIAADQGISTGLVFLKPLLFSLLYLLLPCKYAQERTQKTYSSKTQPG